MTKYRATLFAVCAFATFCLYVACLSSTVTYTGDCSELISASWRGLVAHPSGYPLYCVLARLFALIIPAGEVAWRYNVFSAACGAATAGCVAALIARLTQKSQSPPNPTAAIGGALLLSGLTFFGVQCVIAEVYALNGLLIAAILLCTVAWQQERRFRWLAWLALLLGLSFNSHLSIVFVWPPVLWALWPRAKPLKLRLPARQTALLLLSCFLGFSFTFYLPWAASSFPEPQRETVGGEEFSWFQTGDWGHPVDFARWKKHVTVGQYKSLLWDNYDVQVGSLTLHLKKFRKTPLDVADKFVEWCSYLALQLLWCFPLVFFGAYLAFRRSGNAPELVRGARLGGLLLGTFFLNTLIAMFYDVDSLFDVVHFLFPAYIVMAVWIGLALHQLVSWAGDNGRYRMMIHALLIAAVMSQWFMFVQTASFRGNTSARDAALQRAQAAEELAKTSGKTPTLLLSTDDTLFPFWYAQLILGRAKQARTLWGQPFHAYEKENRVADLVTRLQKDGPVALGQWDEKTDARYPYIALNTAGNLWLASHRALPAPALRVEPLDEGGFFIGDKTRRREADGFVVRFKCPSFVAQKPLAVDGPNHTKQIGYYEVVIAPAGDISDPSHEKVRGLERSLRRLVVQEGTRPGQMLRALLPIEPSVETALGRQDVWYRFVRSTQDENTPWLRARSMTIAIK